MACKPSVADENDSDERRNLIINYLPPKLQEAELVALFSSAGAIESVRIMKNYDGTTKGYGFVKFQNQQEAEQAIKMFDGMNLRGKKLKVAFSRPGGARDNANLFVTHIPAKWTSQSLGQHFKMFGEVVEARILEKDGTSRLCGFVRFNKSQDALDALRHRHGWTPPSAHRQLKVTLATKPQRFGGRKSRHRTSCYRSESITSEIYHSISPDGSFEGSRLLPARPLMGYDSYHQYYRPEWSRHYYGTNHERSVFVYNMPPIFSKEDVQNLCTKYGSVADVILQGDKKGQSLGMAFVTFTCPDDIVRACDGLSGCTILENQVEVELL